MTPLRVNLLAVRDPLRVGKCYWESLIYLRNPKANDIVSQSALASKPKEHFPAERLAGLASLINRIRNIPYFKPDKSPKKEWKVFYGPSWGEASTRAKMALNEQDIDKPGEYFQVCLENVSLSAADAGSRTFSFVDPKFLDNTAWCACHVAQEAVKKVTTSWEWDKKRFDLDAEDGVEADLVVQRDKATNNLIDHLRQLNRDIIEVIGNPTARETAIEDAGNDAWVMARLILSENHPYFFQREMHFAHMSKRLEVWEKGYGLAGDSRGVLYVYCRGSPPEEHFLRDKTD